MRPAVMRNCPLARAASIRAATAPRHAMPMHVPPRPQMAQEALSIVAPTAPATDLLRDRPQCVDHRAPVLAGIGRVLAAPRMRVNSRRSAHWQRSLDRRHRRVCAWRRGSRPRRDTAWIGPACPWSSNVITASTIVRPVPISSTGALRSSAANASGAHGSGTPKRRWLQAWLPQRGAVPVGRCRWPAPRCRPASVWPEAT